MFVIVSFRRTKQDIQEKRDAAKLKAEADAIELIGGFLSITRGKGSAKKCIALFSPGRWEQAEFEGVLSPLQSVSDA